MIHVIKSFLEIYNILGFPDIPKIRSFTFRVEKRKFLNLGGFLKRRFRFTDQVWGTDLDRNYAQVRNIDLVS